MLNEEYLKSWRSKFFYQLFLLFVCAAAPPYSIIIILPDAEFDPVYTNTADDRTQALIEEVQKEVSEP
jgi:hypothetical protein